MKENDIDSLNNLQEEFVKPSIRRCENKFISKSPGYLVLYSWWEVWVIYLTLIVFDILNHLFILFYTILSLFIIFLLLIVLGLILLFVLLFLPILLNSVSIFQILYCFLFLILLLNAGKLRLTIKLKFYFFIIFLLSQYHLLISSIWRNIHFFRYFFLNINLVCFFSLILLLLFLFYLICVSFCQSLTKYFIKCFFALLI